MSTHFTLLKRWFKISYEKGVNQTRMANNIILIIEIIWSNPFWKIYININKWYTHTQTTFEYIEIIICRETVWSGIKQYLWPCDFRHEDVLLYVGGTKVSYYYHKNRFCTLVHIVYYHSYLTNANLRFINFVINNE